MNVDEWTAQILNDVVEAVSGDVAVHLTRRTSQALAELGAAVSGELERLEAEAFEAFPFEPACARGCAHCCSIRAYASPPELFWLARWLREHLKASELDAVRARLRRARARVGSLDREAHFASRVPCPLLDDEHRCIGYDARPIACRTHFSSDARACAGPSDAEVPMHRPSKLIGAGASIGLALGAGRYELDAAPVELIAGLEIALRRGAESRWLAGLPIFAEARSADAGDAPHLRLPIVRE